MWIPKQNAEANKAKDIKDCAGNTLLAAAKKGDISNVKALLETKDLSILEYTDNDGDSVLNNAAWKGHLEVVKLLVEHGARLVHKNKIELNALHHASCKGKHEVCRYLIETGINVNSRTKKGTTPLIMASRNGQTETVGVLLEMGANKDAKDNSGKTALEAAKERDQQPTARFLEKWRSKQHQGEELLIAAKRGSLAEVQRLIKSGAPLEYQDEDMDSVLNNAAWTGNTDVVALLVSLGARLESPNQNNLTALHHASYKGHFSTAEWLIKTGCNVNARSHLGNTPLIMAAKNGLTNTCRTLIEFGADIDAANKEGENAWSAAKRCKKTETYEFLAEVRASSSPHLHCEARTDEDEASKTVLPPSLDDAKRTDAPNPILMAARSAQKREADAELQ